MVVMEFFLFRAVDRVVHRAHIERGDLRAIQGRFSPGHLDGAALVFAATDDRRVNAEVSREAIRRNIPVNVADAPELCSFILPAVLQEEEFTLAVSTGEKSFCAMRFLLQRPPLGQVNTAPCPSGT